MIHANPSSATVGAAEVAEAVLAAVRGGEPVASVAMLGPPDAADPEGPSLGLRMLVWRDSVAGTLGSEALDEAAAALARRDLVVPGTARTALVEAGGARYELYVESHGPPPELVIVGAGHIARPLCSLGALLGFRVVVLDDRPEFATQERFPEAARLVRADFTDPFRDVELGASTHLVLVTRGHKFDFDALRYALRLPFELAYVGMVGSRRRVRAALQELAKEGIERERLLRVHAPIGLDIGAETPEEIAVAVAAEVVRLRRGGTGASLRDRARVVERWVARGDDGC